MLYTEFQGYQPIDSEEGFKAYMNQFMRLWHFSSSVN